MSRALRDAWVETIIVKKLNDALERRDRDGDPQSLKADEILDTIGPSGELRLPGSSRKLLQVIEIDPTEDPCTVVLTDKKVKIAGKISSDARRKHETSSKTKISTIMGGIIKVISYDIYFPGVHGKLFWEGVRYQSQIVDKSASQGRKTGKKEIQKNNMGDKSIKQGTGTGNKDGDAEFPMPEPIFFITEFAFLPDKCSEVRGNPMSVSLRANLKPLLSDLPRKARSGREFSLSEYVPLSRKNSNEPSTSSKVSTGDESSDDEIDEIRSQRGDVSSQDVSQLLFTTQAHTDHLNTFDDLQFPERKSQKRKPGANRPQSPTRGSLGTSAQGKKKTPKPHAHHARKNAEQTKSLNTEPKFINYADGSDSEGPFVSSAVSWEGDSKDLSQRSNNRNKRKRGDLSASFTSSGVGRKGRKKSLGWDKMEQVTLSQTIIPDDQLEILNRPESWYPYTNRHHVSGYNLVPKGQLVPKSHSPRKSNIQVIVPPVRSPVSPPGSTQVSWPSSSVNPPLRGMNAAPDSSFRSGTQSPLAGRLNKNANSADAQVRSNNGSFNQPSQISVQGAEEEHVIPCTQQSEETYEKYESKAKRVTRAANGISKKTPVDPNNVEPSRMAKASKKQKLAAVRKQRPRREYRSEDDENYLSLGDENINELINHPNLPVDVVDPNGRTRVDVFGGILKAQQVDMWEQNGKQPQKRQDEDENEDAQSDTDYDGTGGFDDEAWDKQLASEDERNKVTGVPTKEVVGAIVSKSPSPSPGAKQTEIQQHNEHIAPAESATPDSLVVDHPILSQHPITDEPLPSSQHSGMLLSDRENEKIPESLPGSSIELPMAEHLGDNTDENEEEDEIPQAPLMPLNSALNCTAKVLDNSNLQYPCSDILHTGPAETPKRNDASQAGDGAGIIMEPKGNKSDSLSTVLDSVAPEAINVSKSQEHDEGVAPALSSSSINSTAPSIQVEETPYKKGVSVLGKDLSPTIAKSKSRIDSVCADEGLDLTLIPGTNMEEPHISQELRSPVVHRFPTSRPVTIPERQMSSQDLPWPSVELKDPQKGPPDDFARSQEQLMREAQEHQKIEVPAMSEGNKTRVEDGILSHSAAARQVSRSGPRKPRKVLKVVDFGTQEIRAVGNTRSVTDMLENQKKEFMGYKESPNITGMIERENSSMHERLVVKAPKKNNLLNLDDQSPATPNHSSRPNGEEMASGIDQLNIRKRTQSSPSKKVIAAKKPRIEVSPSKHTSATTLPFSKKQRNFKAPASSQTESSSKSRMKVPGKGDLEDDRGEIGDSEEEDFTMDDCMREDSLKKDFEEKDLEESFELTNDDPMAGFPDIVLSDDDDEPMPMVPETIDLVSENEESESPEPSPPKSKPELYAGLRIRNIYVPGYEELTTEKKNDLDRRRKEYFGVKTSSERLFSAETQRAMTKANLEERERKRKRKSEKEKKASGSKNQGDDEWYRDKDTPMKKLLRNFQELEKSKMKKAELNKPEEK